MNSLTKEDDEKTLYNSIRTKHAHLARTHGLLKVHKDFIVKKALNYIRKLDKHPYLNLDPKTKKIINFEQAGDTGEQVVNGCIIKHYKCLKKISKC